MIDLISELSMLGDGTNTTDGGPLYMCECGPSFSALAIDIITNERDKFRNPVWFCNSNGNIACKKCKQEVRSVTDPVSIDKIYRRMKKKRDR